jgi:hypothetical protein
VTCRRTGDGRVVDNEHARDCNLSGCPGCKPCVPEYGHCGCGRHLAESERWNCARCVGKVREALRKIDGYVIQAHREVVHCGINSAAFMVATPAADPEAHGYLHQSATSGRLCKCRKRRQACPTTRDVPGICPDAAFAIEDARDELHPLTVLGWWEMLWRTELNLPSDEPISVASTRAFLDQHLTEMARRLDPDFDQFRTEVNACRAWLEGILGEGVREERGVECFMCGKARLVKSWDEDPNGDLDHWFCPRDDCLHWWSEKDYRTKVEGTYVQAADRLTASQIAATYRVPEGTIRQWANRGKVAKRGRDESGRMLYDVADVITARDTQSLADA